MCRIPHKTQIKKEEDDMWFNKSCKSARMATAIKENRKNMLYMYIGGGAVDHEQSYLLGGIVVNCKNWRWAALMCAAARIAGLASNNCFGCLNHGLLTSQEEEDGDPSSLATTAHLEFWELTQDIWQRLSTSSDDVLASVDSSTYTETFTRATQSQRIGVQLDAWARTYATAVSQL